MLRILVSTLALASLLLTTPAMGGNQLYKCNINGSLHFQQTPCPPSESKKPPATEAVDAEREKQLARKKEYLATQQAQASSPVSLEPVENARSEPSSPQSSSFKCDGRTYCSQMTSCAEAKYFLSNCPGAKMDGDKNGVPCERQWCSP